jgi:hypothetical protein
MIEESKLILKNNLKENNNILLNKSLNKLE